MKRSLVACLIAILPGAVEGQTVVYVDEDATGANDGTSWEHAFTDLQEGIAHATTGMQIWVAEGTYTPSRVGDRSASFVLRPTIPIYGGFQGNESGLSERLIAENPVVLSGDLNGDDSDIVNLDEPTRADNSYHVVMCPPEHLDTLAVDGVIIRSGNSNGSFMGDERHGGAIYCRQANLTLSNVRMESNAADFGGGLYSPGATIRVRDSKFTGNFALTHGGGLHANMATVWLHGVEFRSNSAAGGGGWYVLGGAMNASHLLIEGNQANGDGGGIWNNGGAQWIFNARIIGNVAYWGGGVFNDQSNTVLANILISGNRSDDDGGGLWVLDSTLVAVNVTVTGNRAAGNGGGAFFWLGEQTLANSIFWNNDAAYDGKELYEPPATRGFGRPEVAYSIVAGGIPPGVLDGGGNGDLDPVFVDAVGDDGISGTEDDDLHLSEGSPAIDSGSNALLPADTNDLDGDGDSLEALPVDLDDMPRIFEPRVGNPTVDMGAYESAVVPDQVVSDNLVGRREDSSLELSVYPNPVRGAAVVVLRSDLGGLAVVKVYDQQGRKVVSLFEGLIMPGGLKEIPFPADLAPGFYVIRASAGRSRAGSSLVKVE